MEKENIIHESSNTANHSNPGIATYVSVWLILLFLTAVTVLTANIQVGGWAIIVCLGIAGIKSTVVLLYFMHVKYEKKLLIKLLMPIVIVLLAIFIGLTYSDVITR